MASLRHAWNEYRSTVTAFSRPARLFLAAVFLVWMAHGIAQVLFNLYLVRAGFRESFVGTAISLSGLGLAVMAWPAGMLADRWGTRRCLVAGAVLEGIGMIARSTLLSPGVIGPASFLSGAGQSLLAIAAAPFITEHSTPRERTHLFSTFFAVELLAGVVGSAFGGAVPRLVGAVTGWPGESVETFRAALVMGGVIAGASALPILAIGRAAAPPPAAEPAPPSRADYRALLPLGTYALCIGMGAGLVIPFMNLYFANRFAASSAQIGLFFSLAQVSTAAAAMLGPLLARRWGTLRTATALQILSLPFLVTLGAERHLGIAVAAFCVRATLMQASSPLVMAFVMETVPARLRARSTSVINMVWNAGWAVSSTASGWIIQHFGYAVPFYFTAALYLFAAVWFYRAFRHGAAGPRGPAAPALSEEAKGSRGEGPFTE